MNKKITTYLSLIILILGATSAVTSNPNADVGNTGATGTTCATSCHSSFALNTAGGSVTTSGLPTTSYVAGQSYPFTLTITHSAANRLKWGFAIKAVNAATGAAIGTFTTTNTTNVRISSSEATSKAAPTTAAAATYTFTGITWKAPAVATAPVSVKFYYVGNAANGDNSRNGDYIYSGSTTVALPIILTNFATTLNGDNVLLNWQVESDLTTNFFEVEKSIDGVKFETISKIIGSNSSIARKYSYIDTKPSKTISYYRLKMVDKDGSVTYSKIETISLKSNANYVSNVYPNPVKKGQNINVEIMSSKEQTAYFIIFNTQGKIVSAKEKIIAQGFNNIGLKLGNFLNADNYYLQVKIGNTISKQCKIAVVE